MKFIHAADIHLDSPLHGLSRYDGAPVAELRNATREALAGLVQLVRSEDAALLVIAGDLFDGDWRDYNTGLFFQRQMAELGRSGVRVFVALGNHDAGSPVTAKLTGEPNVTYFAASAPETHLLPELGLAVHGQSFSQPHVRADLAVAFPAAVPGYFNMGVLHTSLDGRPGHAPYAPTSVATLARKGYDYWALGHVHGREIVSETPLIVFPGNLQGRSVRETGPKGAMVVDTAGGRPTVSFRPLDVVRWECLTVDATDTVHPEDVVHAVRDGLRVAVDAAEGRLVAVRIVVRGRTRAASAIACEPERWEAEVRHQANVLGTVWVKDVRFELRDPQAEARIAASDDAFGALLAALEQPTAAMEWLAAAQRDEALLKLIQLLPADAVRGEDAIRGLVDGAIGVTPDLVATVRDVLIEAFGKSVGEGAE